MIIGVPRETKRDEYRVGMLPVGVEEFTRAGHQVVVEAGAGLGSGLADHDYLRHGAELVPSAQEVYDRAGMVVKVKEPQPEEIDLLRPGQRGRGPGRVCGHQPADHPQRSDFCGR